MAGSGGHEAHATPVRAVAQGEGDAMLGGRTIDRRDALVNTRDDVPA